MKSYLVKIEVEAVLVYEVEADSLADAKEEAVATAEAGDLPREIETILSIKKVYKPEVISE